MADPDAIVELSEFYFAQAEEEIAALGTAVQTQSAEDVRRRAHRLVGASAGCGMLGMLAPLRKLEAQAKEGDLCQAADLFAQLPPLLNQSRAEIARWREKRGSL